MGSASTRKRVQTDWPSSLVRSSSIFETAAELLKALYAPYNRNHDRMIVMDVRSAELTKQLLACAREELRVVLGEPSDAAPLSCLAFCCGLGLNVS